MYVLFHCLDHHVMCEHDQKASSHKKKKKKPIRHHAMIAINLFPLYQTNMILAQSNLITCIRKYDII
jgi:hypothetical protein